MKKNKIRSVLLIIAFVVVAATSYMGAGDYEQVKDKDKDLGFGNIESVEQNEAEDKTESEVSFVYAGEDIISVNGGVPEFTDEEIKAALSEKPYEEYAPLDDLGRCGTAIGVLDESMMPTEERGSIGQYKPSGWQTITYPDLISTRYLYNRGHLLAHCLGGESTNNRNNLITMTRQCNENMIPYEVKTARYLEENPNNKVIYRVTPLFEGNNLVATGVKMEIKSLGDNRISENIFLFNVQDGIKINYVNGSSQRAN